MDTNRLDELAGRMAVAADWGSADPVYEEVARLPGHEAAEVVITTLSIIGTNDGARRDMERFLASAWERCNPGESLVG